MTESLTLHTHLGEPVAYRRPQGRATFNLSAGPGVSWAAWTWGPITGCLHGCEFCYARSITLRFTNAFPAGFTPLFHPERLDAPANTRIPASHADDPAWSRVFVTSMGDMYGRWVPQEWIDRIHAVECANTRWTYMHLTQSPGRYVGLPTPPGAWLGTTVHSQTMVRRAQAAMAQVKADAKRDGRQVVTWLSCEPLRERLAFTDLSMFDLVVIGAQTRTRQPHGSVPAFAPLAEWVLDLTRQALEAGCRVHWKDNLRARPGVVGNLGDTWYDQYPDQAAPRV